MKQKIKIRGEFHWKFEDFFITKILAKKYNLQRVDTNPNITIGLVEPRPFTQEFLSSPKSLLVSGENLYYKLNLFKLNEYLTKKTKIPFSKFNKILPKKILNMKLGLMRPKYYKYIKSLAKSPKKGKYAIVCNDIKGKNILNLPFFMQRSFKIKDFEKKKITKIPKKFCCIIISNESAFDRIKFTKKLSEYKKVDIYGKTSLTNSDNSLLPKGFDENAKFYSQYKFVICFENSFEKEYITEKLPNAILGKSIPIYRGAPNVKEYFNTKSFINCDDYNKDYDKMINKIIELDKDDKKYLEFMKTSWLTEENKSNIKNKQKEVKQFLKRVVEE